MSTMNQIEFARHIGVVKSRVTQLKAAGRLVMTTDGKMVEVEASIARIAATAAGRSDVAARHAENRQITAEDVEAFRKSEKERKLFDQKKQIEQLHDKIDSTELGIENTGRAKAKTLLLHYENSSLKIEMALRQGKRYERAVVKREAHGLGDMLRAGIERVIDQTAARLAASSDATERSRIIEAEIHRLRRMIKRELPRALRRMRDAGAGKS